MILAGAASCRPHFCRPHADDGGEGIAGQARNDEWGGGLQVRPAMTNGGRGIKISY